MLSLFNFYILLSPLLTVLLLVPTIASLAVRIGAVDKKEGRRVNINDTPRLGGFALFFGFLLTMVLFFQLDRDLRGYLAGSVIIFLTGMLDDIVGVSPYKKLGGEFAAALALVLVGGVHLTSLGNLFGLGQIDLGLFAIPFTVIAVIGVINAFNLLDGLDGLATGVSFFSSIAFAIIAYLTGNSELFSICLVLSGVTLGFLRYNTYPASIFMGDAGSLFLGFSMSYIAIQCVTWNPGAVSPLAPLMILGVPVIDTFHVMVLRLIKGQPLFNADKQHIHHRLLDIGIGHRSTVILIYCFTYVLSFLAIALFDKNDYMLSAVLAISYPALYLSVKLLAHISVRRKHHWTNDNSLRTIGTYRKFVSISRALRVIIKYSLLLAILMSVAAPAVHNLEFGVATLILAAFLFYLYQFDKYRGQIFLLFFVYISGAFIVFVTENYARNFNIFGLQYIYLSHSIFFVLFLLVGAKVLMRGSTLKLMSSPLEYLLLFLVVSTAFLPVHLTVQYHLLTVIGKSVILFAAYKFVLIREPWRNRKIIYTTMIVLIITGIKFII